MESICFLFVEGRKELSFNEEEYNIESSHFISSFDQQRIGNINFLVVHKTAISFANRISSDEHSFAMLLF